MMKNYHIKNIRIIDKTQDRVGDVFVKDGKISDELLGEDYHMIDGANKILMPGFFDPHVHFREPGFEHKENFASGSRAAIAGGVTSFFDMPNTQPATFTKEILEEKRTLASQNSLANFGLYFGAGIGNKSEIEKVKNVPGVKLYLNTTTGNLKMDDEDQWRKVFRTGKKTALHAEGETFFRAVDIWVEEGFPCELHLCHASLASEIEKIKNIRTQYPEQAHRITVEVCPHHLFLTDKERIACGAICCMKPELATEKDLEAMWEAIAEGHIDCFATDHAPHTWKEKEEGAFGIPGVETFLPLLFTEFQKRKWDLKQLAYMTSARTIDIFHVQDKKGQIREGYEADLVVLDPQFKGKIDPKYFYSKAQWSPFEGVDISVKVEKTFVNGVLVFDEGMVDENSRGKEIKFGL